MERTVLHIDVNSAYLSWEACFRKRSGITGPDLREIPSAVGGNPETRHGIILAKSKPCKPYGIQTGETLYNALKKCPHLVIVPPNYSLYMEYSGRMMDLIREYSPSVKRFSIDECFVDLTGVICFYKTPMELAEEIKNRIRDELGFTVSVGVSTNKLLAKMASEFIKPDGLSTCWKHEIPEKIWTLPIADLYMCGRKTEAKMHSRGIYKIGDFAAYRREAAVAWLGKFGGMLHDYANGIESTAVDAVYTPKNRGLGNSTTTPKDVTTKAGARMYLLSLTEMVAMRLRVEKVVCSLVSVTLRDNTFRTYAHQRKLLFATDSTNVIYKVACELLDEMWTGEPLRHFGVRVTEFGLAENAQISFFEPFDASKWTRIDPVIDRLRARFGKNSVTRAVFLGSSVRPITGGVGDDDFPIMSSIL